MEKKLSETKNGEMATNMEELKQLGKQMENMRDGQELEEDNRISDPIQFDEEESK